MFECITVDEAAKALRCSDKSIRKMCRDAEIEAFKRGKQWLIPKHALAAYAENQQNKIRQAAIDNAKRSNVCQSRKARMEYGKFISARQVVNELDSLLKQQISKRRKNCTINANTKRGGKSN